MSDVGRVYGLGLVSTRVSGCTLFTHRLKSSSFLGLPYRIQNMNPEGTTMESMGKLNRN